MACPDSRPGQMAGQPTRPFRLPAESAPASSSAAADILTTVGDPPLHESLLRPNQRAILNRGIRGEQPDSRFKARQVAIDLIVADPHRCVDSEDCRPRP